MKRHRSIKLAFAVLLVLVIVISSVTIFAKSNKGEVVLLGCTGTELNTVKEMIPDFEAETGIRLIVEDTPWPQLYEKVSMELLTNTRHYSAISFPCQWLPEFSRYLEPLDPKKVVLDKDFPDTLVNAYKYKNVQYGIPFYTMALLYYYRTDIFKEAGVKPPKTWTEYINVLTKIKETMGNRILAPGILPLKRATHLASQFFTYLWSFGGDVMDKNGKATLNSEAAMKALQFMYDQYHNWKVVPPSSFELSFVEAGELFAQGRVAVSVDFNRRINLLTNPNTSKVAGKWDAFCPPNSSLIGPWGLTIPKNAPNKDAGYTLITWLTKPKNLKRMALKGIATGRSSLFTDPDVVRQTPQMPVILESVKRGRFETWPSVEALNQKIITLLSEALSNQKPMKQALDELNAEADKLFGNQ